MHPSPCSPSEAVGSGGVCAVNRGGTTHSDIADVYTGRALALLGVRLHLLARSSRSDFRSPQAAAPESSPTGGT